MSSGYTDSDSGFSPSAPRGTPSDSLVAANPPSPPAGHGAFANVPGFVDVSAVTACDMGHDTRLSGGALAGTIALLPWSLAYHATKRTRVCRRCGINVTREKTLDPFR
jgi:hypothetical protein